MAKYLTLWEMDTSKTPVDPKEQATLYGKQLEMVKKQLAEGLINDWGIFAGGGGGYAIGEGDATDVFKGVLPFSPYAKFKTQPVLSVDEVAEVMKSMA